MIIINKPYLLMAIDKKLFWLWAYENKVLQLCIGYLTIIFNGNQLKIK